MSRGNVIPSRCLWAPGRTRRNRCILEDGAAPRGHRRRCGGNRLVRTADRVPLPLASGHSFPSGGRCPSGPAVGPATRAAGRAPRPPRDALLPLAAQGRRGVLQGGLLASLATMTVAVPLSGFVGADSSVALPARSVGAVVGTSWSPEAAPQTSEALEGSQTAASRARVRAPLTLTTCLPSGGSANGEREVEVDPTTIYRPLQEGTFEFASAFAWRVSPISGQLLKHEGVDLSAPSARRSTPSIRARSSRLRRTRVRAPT